MRHIQIIKSKSNCRTLIILRLIQYCQTVVRITGSLTGEGCGAVLNDTAPFSTVAAVFHDLWSWTPTEEELPILHQLVTVSHHH